MKKSRVILTFMFLILPTLACGLVDDVLEPEATLSAPPTVVNLPPTSTVGSDEPANGDSTAPTPTLAVSPTPGGPSLEELGEPPETLEELEQWITQATGSDAGVEDVCRILAEAQWRQAEDTCSEADLNDDEVDEWLLTIDYSRLQEGEQPPLLQEGHPGDLWIVGEDGMLHQVRDEGELDFFSGAPQLVELADMTGDEQPEAIVTYTTCGAHTCYHYYQVIGAPDGPVRSLVQLPEDGQPAEETIPETVSLAYVDQEEVRDANDDELPDLVIHGGIVGSAGAGIQRARTEIWSWSGEAVTLAEQVWEETNYRHHWLYNANYAFDQEEYDIASARYEEVIVNPDLENVAFFSGTDEDVYDYARQFAGFRLSLMPLMRGDITESTRWRNWLNEEYPDAAITAAADRLFSEWESNGNNLAAACDVVTGQLQSADNPTGPLSDMGYNNPSLTAETVCPIE